MIQSIILTVIGACTLGLFLFWRGEEGSNIKALLAKTGASVLFVSVALLGSIGGNIDMTFTALITLGLLFGLLGDVFLDLKFIDKPNSDIHTFAGMIVFGVGHLLYIPSVIMRYNLKIESILISALIAAICAAAILVVTLKVMKYDYGKFLIPATGYAFLLIFFTVLSIAALITGHNPGTDAVLLTVGSILFFLSDVILSMLYFGGQKGRLFVISNHLLYYAAQFLIAFAVVVNN